MASVTSSNILTFASCDGFVCCDDARTCSGEHFTHTSVDRSSNRKKIVHTTELETFDIVFILLVFLLALFYFTRRRLCFSSLHGVEFDYKEKISSAIDA